MQEGLKENRIRSKEINKLHVFTYKLRDDHPATFSEVRRGKRGEGRRLFSSYNEDEAEDFARNADILNERMFKLRDGRQASAFFYLNELRLFECMTYNNLCGELVNFGDGKGFVKIC